MVRPRSSKPGPAMTSREREDEGHSRSRGRLPSPHRTSPQRDDPFRISRAGARSSGRMSRSPVRPTERVSRSPIRPSEGVSRSPTRPCGRVSRSPTRPSRGMSRSPTRPCGRVSRSPTRPCGRVSRSPTRPCERVSRSPTRPSGGVSRSPTRPSGCVSRVPRSRSSGPFCSSRCRRRNSVSPVRCPAHTSASRHRALEEETSSTSSTYPILQYEQRGGGGGGDDSTDSSSSSRMLERRAASRDEEEDEYEEERGTRKTVGGRVCRVAKLVSGFLISMGLVLVFYVIITTIMGQSSPLDIFNFEIGTEDLLKHKENVTNSTILTDLERLEEPLLEGLLESDSHTIEDSKSYDSGDQSLGVWQPNGEKEGHIATRDMNFKRENKTDAEGRSYMGYIPVLLNNEEEEKKEEEARSHSHSNPLLVPVMIAPSGGSGSFFPNNGRPQFGVPPLRPPYQSLPPRDPVQGPPLVHKMIDVPPKHQFNSFSMRSNSHPPMPRLPPSRTPQGRSSNGLPIVPNHVGGSRLPSGILSNSLPPNILRVSGGQQLNLGHSVGVGQLVGNINQPTGGSLTGQHSSPIPNIYSQRNVGSYTNNGNPMTGINNGQGTYGVSGFGTKLPSSTGQDIWNSLFEIMNRPNTGSNVTPGTMNRESTVGSRRIGNNGPHATDGSSEMMARPARLGRLPLSPGVQSTPDLSYGNPPVPQRLNGPRPGPPQARHIRPRLHPSSRISGPLPKPFPRPRPHPQPLPRYRYHLPPVPPPLGMPAVPRRPPRRPTRHRPPKDFQYPPDSGSIQDIIQYMNDKNRQGNRVNLPPGFTVGSQDHVVGPNPFADINIEGTDNSDFGTASPNDFNNGGNRFTSGGNGFITGGNNLNGNNFHSGGNQYSGGFGGGDGNGNIASGGGGIHGFNSGGSTNYNDNHFNVGNSFNEGNQLNNGGQNYNGGQHVNSDPYNNGGSHFNNVGYNSHNSGSSLLPPVQNTYDPTKTKSLPFNIMLDVYPMEDSSTASGPRPFQTSISIPGDTGRFNTNSDYVNGYSNGGYSQRERFSPQDDVNKHEIVLHLNLYSRAPSVNRRQGGGDVATGRSGAVSLEVPLTGTLSPLDIYTAIMSKARSHKPQAQVQVISGQEEEESREEGQIELFDLEEGPMLLQAIEQGLKKLNAELPPHQRFVLNDEPPSSISLHHDLIAEKNSTSRESTGYRRSPASPSHDRSIVNDYQYYDYYDYQDTGPSTSPTTTARSAEVLS
ncbi:uncharacterized protein [Procambarus clarkii]|uniref:uncharacterized protein n=1 Tax=Procambarus clarkii TaxID=6728 RepID=UPI003744A7FB